MAENNAIVLPAREDGKDPLAVEFGRRGGTASQRKFTPEERSERARRAVQARWDKATLGERRTHTQRMRTAKKKRATA